MATAIEPTVTRDPERSGSDRSFGVVFSVVFIVIGCWPLLHLEPPRWWSMGIGFAFAVVAIARPQILKPFNRLWLAFGRVLHRLMSPLIMGVIFFVCVTPIALIMRLRGKDLLALKRRDDLESYWIRLSPAPPASDAMKRQF